MEKNKLIVIEGACDAAGKTTQCFMLGEHLNNDGSPWVGHHFPTYDTYHGVPVERYLKGEMGNREDLNPYFINSLYAMDRGVAWYTGLKQAYESGNYILLDRYTTSSLIYQGAEIVDVEERKRFIDFVVDFEYNKIGIKEPDNVILLTAPFDIIAGIRNRRTNNAGIMNDIYERDYEFMKKVYDTAHFVADYLSWDKVECSNGESMLDKSLIHEKVYSLVKRNK